MFPAGGAAAGPAGADAWQRAWNESEEPGGQQPNPWQSAYPAGDPAGPGRPPYGSNQPDGPQPGWFPPPIRPGQSPAGPPIQLPRGAFGTAPKRGTSKALIAILAAFAVLVVGGGVALGLSSADDEEPLTAPPASTPTPTPTPSPTPTPTPTPTAKPTPPPKPKPKPKPVLTPHQVVTQNVLYKSGRVLASRCREPGFRPTSYATVRAYYNRILPCLNKSWYPSIKRSGYQWKPPKLVVYGGTIKTPCGPTTRPYYCNGAIYMPWPPDVQNYRTNQTWARALMANTIAHEYGHHVQWLSGILDASWTRTRQLPSQSAKLLESRRRELQASCFGAIYLGADRTWFPMRGSMLTMWRYVVSHSGDEYSKIRDHGSRTYHNYWSLRGYNTLRPSGCNTFTASTKATS